MTRTLDDSTVASHPGRVRLSPAKLKRLEPDFYSFLSTWIFRRRRSEWLTHLEEHLFYGDSRAAMVISTASLLIAAYTDEIDCVALLRFQDHFVADYGLEVGSRLITVNLYTYLENTYEKDLTPGPGSSGNYQNFSPLIADFLTDDLDRLAERKAEISETEWRRTKSLGRSYLANRPGRARDGRPLSCSLPAEAIKSPADSETVRSALASAFTEPYNAPTPFLEVLKRIFYLVAFVLLTLGSVRGIGLNSRLGLFAVAVFGSMLVLSAVSILRVRRDIRAGAGVRKKVTFKGAYMWAGTLAVSLLLGVVGEMIIGVMTGVLPRLAIWVASFVSITAFYPFRDKHEKDLNFPLWLIYAGLMGILSVVIAQFMSWLERG